LCGRGWFTSKRGDRTGDFGDPAMGQGGSRGQEDTDQYAQVFVAEWLGLPVF